MPYLIDGHNLISYLPDIDLNDPDDEAKLVLKLRGFMARRRKKCTVIFDQGLPGGRSHLSTPSVTVIFASANQTNADAIIRERIKRATDLKGLVIVTSDREIITEAEHAGMEAMRCVEFAHMMLRPYKPKPHKGLDENVWVSPKEVDEWLLIFGEELDEAHTERLQKKKKKSYTSEYHAAQKAAAKKQLTKPKNPANKEPDMDDVDGWLEMFDAAGEVEPTDKAPTITPRIESKGSKKKADPNMPMPTDVDGWLEVFGEEGESKPTDLAPGRSDPSKQGRYGRKDKREPTVHKNMSTSDEIYLSEGEVDVWMDFFGADDDD